MHKTAIFQLLNIEVVLISEFLTNVNTNKYFVVVVGRGRGWGLQLACAYSSRFRHYHDYAIIPRL